MAVSVDIDLGYEFAVKAPFKDVFDVLSHVPTSAGFFPKVDKLVDMGDDTYRWEMAKVGTAQVNLQTVYASKYKSDAKKGSVVWTPVKGVGNAQVSGSWKITDKKGSTDIVLKNKARAVQSVLDGLSRQGAMKIGYREAQPISTAMVVVLTYWLSFEYVREPRKALEPEAAAAAISRGAMHVLSLLLPYVDAASREHLQALVAKYES